MKVRVFTIPTLIGLIIAAVGIVSPILWDRYKTKSSIELQYLSTTTLVEKSDKLKNLSILYSGKPIECLSRIDFVLLNSGRTPILDNDLISPPTIVFSSGTRLLDTRIENVSPQNLMLNYKMDEKNRTVEISFPLLNPSDFVHFSILTANRESSFSVHARIVGVRDIVVRDLSDKKGAKPTRVPWTVYAVGFFTALCFFVIIRYAIPYLLEELKVKLAFKEGELEIPQNATRDKYVEFVQNTFTYKTSSEQKPILTFIETLPKGKPLTKDQQTSLNAVIKGFLDANSDLTLASMFYFLIGVIGLIYVLLKIF